MASVLLQNQKFSTFNLDAHISDVRQLEKAWESYPESSKALTYFHATDPTYFYMLNKLACNVIINYNRVQDGLAFKICVYLLPIRSLFVISTTPFASSSSQFYV